MQHFLKTPTKLAVLAGVVFSGILAIASAHEGCLESSLGKIYCPPPMGGIARTALGEIVCGKGQCVKTKTGSVECSSQEGGYSYIDRFGHAVCTGGCETGSAAMCQKPVQGNEGR